MTAFACYIKSATGVSGYQPEYCGELISLGYADGLEQRSAIEGFLGKRR